MAIARFENIAINNLTFSESGFGEGETTQTKWFDTRARVSDVANSLKIADKYRLYQELTQFTLNSWMDKTNTQSLGAAKIGVLRMCARQTTA
jgi:hypothetical protein